MGLYSVFRISGIVDFMRFPHHVNTAHINSTLSGGTTYNPWNHNDSKGFPLL